jgi:acetoin utilization deacetylase AcuC-like enzyme
MGFCIFNNVAVAAAAARALGCARVAILDWDVHHGNGTQDAFYDDPTVLYLSTHQYPFYPGSGDSGEIGEGEGKGRTVNVPLPAGSGDPEYAAAFDEVIVPALRAFRPELILVSAGYDAFVDDPLAGMRVTIDGFRHMAARTRAMADELAGGRMVCVLEGGYDLRGIAGGALATFEVLANDDTPADVIPTPPSANLHPGARRAIEATKRAIGPYLPGLDRDLSVGS